MIESDKYKKDKEKTIRKKQLSEKQIQDTINIFDLNPNDNRLRPHNINCKHDKQRRSISIGDTGYRILFTKKDGEDVFVRLVDHDTYDRLNKDC